MPAEQSPNSEATVRLPKMSAEATVQIAAKADVVPPPPAPPTPPPPPETKAVGTAHSTTVDRPQLSPLEKAQRRLIKNLIMSGFFVVVLVVVFYFLSRP